MDEQKAIYEFEKIHLQKIEELNPQDNARLRVRLFSLFELHGEISKRGKIEDESGITDIVIW